MIKDKIKKDAIKNKKILKLNDDWITFINTVLVSLLTVLCWAILGTNYIWWKNIVKKVVGEGPDIQFDKYELAIKKALELKDPPIIPDDQSGTVKSLFLNLWNFPKKAGNDNYAKTLFTIRNWNDLTILICAPLVHLVTLISVFVLTFLKSNYEILLNIFEKGNILLPPSVVIAEKIGLFFLFLLFHVILDCSGVWEITKAIFLYPFKLLLKDDGNGFGVLKNYTNIFSLPLLTIFTMLVIGISSQQNILDDYTWFTLLITGIIFIVSKYLSNKKDN